jgi:ATP-binding protein involved in chromosome partitioning
VKVEAVARRPTVAEIRSALTRVYDPEIGKPITDLGMVKDITVGADGVVTVAVYLTVGGCPLKDRIIRDVTAAVETLAGVSEVRVVLDVMSDEQRATLRRSLRGDSAQRTVPFAEPGSRTRVYCVASGKGGVGKSSITVNLAVAMARHGLRVGVLDADVHGHSVPRMLDVTGTPAVIDKMIIPPVAYGVKVVSMAMFTTENAPVAWRGPMLHRAVRQFLADVYWGDLDALLLDLPPGTGDIAISVAQLVPNSEIVVVTTPALAAAEVAQRAGALASRTRQRLAGVIENMSWWDAPDGSRVELFGAGGGTAVAGSLSRLTGVEVPLLERVPFDPRLSHQGDAGLPLVLSAPQSPAATALSRVAAALADPAPIAGGCPASAARQSGRSTHGSAERAISERGTSTRS